MGYANWDDFLAYGMSQRGAYAQDRDTIEKLLDTVSEEFDSYANPQHKTPFLAGSKSLPAVIRSICAVAVFEYTSQRGFEVNAGNEAIVMRAETARKWWQQIALGRVRLDVVDQTPTVNDGGAVVLSTPSKWS